jgi:hypothetical protein
MGIQQQCLWIDNMPWWPNVAQKPMRWQLLHHGKSNQLTRDHWYWLESSAMMPSLATWKQQQSETSTTALALHSPTGSLNKPTLPQQHSTVLPPISPPRQTYEPNLEPLCQNAPMSIHNRSHQHPGQTPCLAAVTEIDCTSHGTTCTAPPLTQSCFSQDPTPAVCIYNRQNHCSKCFRYTQCNESITFPYSPTHSPHHRPLQTGFLLGEVTWTKVKESHTYEKHLT